MRYFFVFLIVFLLTSCEPGMLEETVFRYTLEKGLLSTCGDEDKACQEAVKSQISACMETSNWRQYLENQDSEEEFQRFIEEFYSCIVDENGEPYFSPNIDENEVKEG